MASSGSGVNPAPMLPNVPPLLQIRNDRPDQSGAGERAIYNAAASSRYPPQPERVSPPAAAAALRSRSGERRVRRAQTVGADLVRRALPMLADADMDVAPGPVQRALPLADALPRQAPSTTIA